MSADRFAEIERLCHEARSRRPEERSAFLDEACGGDQSLRREVESLLSFETGADRFLSRPALEEAARTNHRAWEPATWPTIPGYTVRRVLGEGGMGVVYFAEQEKPFRRQVALKLIKPGMDTRQVVARFETERQALALMDHPNIAAVFDAGSTKEGRPYLVMEYVDGVSITDYCDHHRLSTRDRLALFVQVCAAVQHAHQKGVIHRDLKPSNVLVTEKDGRALPKVIDFGTAKAVGGAWNATATQGGQGMVLGTLEYMSPEQAALSADIDTATDVYSLGVLLYELLVGRLPFDTDELRAAGYDEIRRVIRESDPPKPSVRVEQRNDKSGAAARARQTDAPGLTRQLRGDLDWITLKALEKDRTRRYTTVAAFATDIGRFLGDQPVEARPPSSAYRIRKFTRRNRGAVAAAASLFIGLVTGLVISRWQYLRAEDALIELGRQRAEAESLRFRADSARATAEGATADAINQSRYAEQLRVIAENEAQRAFTALGLSDYRNYVNTIAAADAEVRASRFSDARERLLKVPVAKRGWEWEHLYLRAESSRTLVDFAPCPAGSPVPAIDALVKDPDGKRIYFRRCQRVNSWNTETLEHSVALSSNVIVAAAASGRRVEYSLTSDKATPRSEKTWNVYVAGAIPKLIGTVDREPACADLSRDGRMLAIGLRPLTTSVSETDVFQVWDVENARRISQVEHPKPPSRDTRVYGGMNCLVRLSADATLLATSGAVVRLWDATTGMQVHRDSGQAGILPQAIAFSPTSRQLAIGRRNGLIDVLDFVNSNWTVTSLDGGAVVRPRPLNVQDSDSDIVSRRNEEVRAIAFAPDGRTIASGQADRVIAWDMNWAHARKLLNTHQSAVTGLVVDERLVYSSRADGTVDVTELYGWGASGTTKLEEITGLSFRIASSADGRTVVLGSKHVEAPATRQSASLLTLYQPDSDQRTQVMLRSRFPADTGFSLVVPLADNRTILTGLGILGSLTRWDLQPATPSARQVGLPTMDRMEPGCAAERLDRAAVSPNDRYIAMRLGNCIVVRDLATARTLATLRPDRHGFNEWSEPYVTFLNDESILVTVSHEQRDGNPAINSIVRWNWTMNSVSSRRLLPTPTRPLLPVAVSKDGRRVALAEAGCVTIWDGALAREIGRIPTRSLNGNYFFALNADGTRLALAASDQTSVVVWDTATSQQLLTLTDDDAPQFLTFTLSGQLIAVNSAGGLTIWETQRPKCAQCPKTPAPMK